MALDSSQGIRQALEKVRDHFEAVYDQARGVAQADTYYALAEGSGPLRLASIGMGEANIELAHGDFNAEAVL